MAESLVLCSSSGFSGPRRPGGEMQRERRRGREPDDNPEDVSEEGETTEAVQRRREAPAELLDLAACVAQTAG